MKILQHHQPLHNVKLFKSAVSLLKFHNLTYDFNIVPGTNTTPTL